MSEPIIVRSLVADRGWKVTKNGKLVAHFPNQSIAEKAAARLCRAEANKGNLARAILHKKDGTVASERSYSRATTPWLGR